MPARYRSNSKTTYRRLRKSFPYSIDLGNRPRKQSWVFSQPWNTSPLRPTRVKDERPKQFVQDVLSTPYVTILLNKQPRPWSISEPSYLNEAVLPASRKTKYLHVHLRVEVATELAQHRSRRNLLEEVDDLEREQRTSLVVEECDGELPYRIIRSQLRRL